MNTTNTQGTGHLVNSNYIKGSWALNGRERKYEHEWIGKYLNFESGLSNVYVATGHHSLYGEKVKTWHAFSFSLAPRASCHVASQFIPPPTFIEHHRHQAITNMTQSTARDQQPLRASRCLQPWSWWPFRPSSQEQQDARSRLGENSGS